MAASSGRGSAGSGLLLVVPVAPDRREGGVVAVVLGAEGIAGPGRGEQLGGQQRVGEEVAQDRGGDDEPGGEGCGVARLERAEQVGHLHPQTGGRSGPLVEGPQAGGPPRRVLVVGAGRGAGGPLRPPPPGPRGPGGGGGGGGPAP